MPDCIYLRKSRKDDELEALGAEETLARHRRALLAHAERLGRTIAAEYAEVATGDSLAARPEMQRLLRDVEAGKWDAVHVMEVERLARGDSLDQGIVARAFKYSGTRIVTPLKTYDPADEFDEEYFEFGLFMSRREYRSITRRMQRGRAASVGEGKWPASRAPYGYRRVKLEGQKGWTLAVDEARAGAVRDVFRWYTEGDDADGGRLGPTEIARRLNAAGIPAAQGGDWTGAVVRAMLQNPAYAGLVRWGARAAVKRVVDGCVTVSRPLAPPGAALVAPGLHPPLVARPVFDAAQALLTRRGKTPPPPHPALQNPLAGLLVCGVCGRAMTRRPYADGRAALLCPRAGCPTVSSDLALVERTLVEALQRWYAGFDAGSAPDAGRPAEAAIAAAAASRASLERLRVQQRRACELVEQGVYSPELYAARAQSLSLRAADAQRAWEAAEAELARLGAESPLPCSVSVAEAYAAVPGAEERNALLRCLAQRVVYSKTRRERCGGSDMRLEIYPRLPRPARASDSSDVHTNWDISKWSEPSCTSSPRE